MTKKEHIEYWIDTSQKDWEIVQRLYNSGDFVYSLFFAHLTIEKLSKAIWIKTNPENYPPKVHNLIYLLDNPKLKLDDKQKDFLILLNEFNIEARYPDYKQKIFQICTKDYTDEILSKVKELRECLLNKLQ